MGNEGRASVEQRHDENLVFKSIEKAYNMVLDNHVCLACDIWGGLWQYIKL